ncbi:TadE/TadG family type IV pilus assembly protein [Zhihengliuella flava]|uniref:Flp pilus assembly protein TadG n=1 Tax=Zhihengliuella flava TaxID=1285193 RepID=A0A931DEQ2_9MICC|nr:Tad domain-containing protein [Zhihengliuella flava]MBG6085418.1 Flp pilus assembly protein TadG [Zhihengliuella flava]
MRRLTHREWAGERGGSSVLVAGLMIILLLFVALAVDVGKLFWDRAELQNGADAAALGVANACAADAASPDCTTDSALGSSLSAANAADGAAAALTTIDLSAQTVTVVTEAREAGGPDANGSAVWFGQLFGTDTVGVRARAVAAWGGPTIGDFTFPLAFSECALADFLASGSDTAGWLTYAASPCNPHGNAIPGNWGWLDPDGNCEVHIDVDDGVMYPGDTGNSMPASGGVKAICQETLEDWITAIDAAGATTVYFPVISDSNGLTGSNVEWEITGVAAFEIEAWKFSGGGSPDQYPNNASLPAGCTGSCRGVYGKFVEIYEPDELGGGGGIDYGVTVPPALIE